MANNGSGNGGNAPAKTKEQWEKEVMDLKNAKKALEDRVTELEGVNNTLEEKLKAFEATKALIDLGLNSEALVEKIKKILDLEKRDDEFTRLKGQEQSQAVKIGELKLQLTEAQELADKALTRAEALDQEKEEQDRENKSLYAKIASLQGN